MKTKVEIAKEESHQLRGTLKPSLQNPEVDHFAHDDVQILKFHGIYQQDDRDRRKQGKHHNFMVRAALPGGVLTASQYLALHDFAERYADGTLRVTTRQGLQYHGIIKDNLKPTIAAMNQHLVSTLAACGDVARNVMACPAPVADSLHRQVQAAASAIAEALRPASRAYHEIWLDQEKVADTQVAEEPFYGKAYLPRKFKTAVASGCDNCVDVYTQDCGLIAVFDDNVLVGFNVVVGGGQGMTNGKADTFAALAKPLGFVAPEHAAETVKTVAAVFRDYGNRNDRRHARIKYLLAEWGIDRFREEFQRVASFPLLAYRPLAQSHYHDHLGPHLQGDGRWFYGIWVESGRIRDGLKAALHQIVQELQPGVRFTPHQNVLLTDLSQSDLKRIEEILDQHGVGKLEEMSLARRQSMACPALPTCGQALAESERLIPTVVRELEEQLRRLGLWGAPMSLRMTGCPNGCARPYTADMAFVGRSLDMYQIYVGGRSQGDRLGDLFAADVPSSQLVPTVTPLLELWASQRLDADESLGDFYQRLRGQPPLRQSLTGREEATGLVVIQ